MVPEDPCVRFCRVFGTYARLASPPRITWLRVLGFRVWGVGLRVWGLGFRV